MQFEAAKARKGEEKHKISRVKFYNREAAPRLPLTRRFRIRYNDCEISHKVGRGKTKYLRPGITRLFPLLTVHF